MPRDLLPLPEDYHAQQPLFCSSRRSRQRLGRKSAVENRLSLTLWALNECWGDHAFKGSKLSSAQKAALDRIKEAIVQDRPPDEDLAPKAALEALLGGKVEPGY